MSKSDPRWLLCRAKRPTASLRLYCFPHSGGSPGEYLRWADSIPDNIELWGVQLPGRGSRSAQPALTDMPTLVNSLVSEADFTPPYAFFGHSLGAPIAYQTALALRDTTGAGPIHLIASAYAAPHLHRPPVTLETVAADGLLDVVERLYGPVPAVIRQDPASLEAYLGVLRADLTVVATYRYVATTPLSCPITVVSGTDDIETESRLSAWRDHTTAECTVRMFPGGHFYFRDQQPAFLRYLSHVLLGEESTPRVG